MTRWLVLGAVLGSVLLGTGCVVKVTPRQDYEHCVTNSDCQSNLCAEIHAPTTTGGVIIGYQCTRGCASAGSCENVGLYNSGCLMIAADATPGSFYCYQGCANDFDCRGAGRCTPITGGAIGAACFPSY